MRAAVWICAVLSAGSLFACERMTVSVCNVGRLSDAVVARTEATAEALFRSIDVEIVWAKCEDAPLGEEAAQQHWFTIRLRGEGLMAPVGPASLDTLGEAFLSDDQSGYLAEVYDKPVEELAFRRDVDAATLLAFVTAHEIGHLLLGPGHAPDGIMRASWEARDMDAIRKGWLKFNGAEAARIRQVLREGR